MTKKMYLSTCILILGLLSIHRIFSNISSSPIQRWDEETNISVVKNSIHNKSFPVLMLDNKPFFEKPPLWYWLNIVWVRAFGLSIGSIRMTSAISGILIILFTVYMSWRWWGSFAGLVTWVVLLTTHHLFTNNPGNIFSTHTFKSADLDALQILFIVITFFFIADKPLRTITALFVGLSSGLAVLVKGPLGFLPLVAYVLAVYIKKEKLPQPYWLAIGLCISTILPWYLFMVITFGQKFIIDHLVYHVALRSIIPIEGHIYSMEHYLLLLVNFSVFPAGIFYIGSFLYLFIRHVSEKKIFFLVLMNILTFFIPTCMQTKLSWYILPLYPFAALLIGGCSAIFFQKKDYLLQKE